MICKSFVPETRITPGQGLNHAFMDASRATHFAFFHIANEDGSGWELCVVSLPTHLG
jgi:hypothetical protein